MRILFIHADHMEYEIKERTKTVEDVSEGQKKVRLEDLLVAFVTVEKRDERSPDEIAIQGSREISDVASKVKAHRILIYPYAHLSPSLSAPKSAINILGKLELELRGDYEVHRAPFGWYKSFNIACKGHPLSELSKEITIDERTKLKSIPEGEEIFLVLDSEGMEHEPSDFGRGSDDFRTLMEKEALKQDLGHREEPKYLRLCQKFGLEWEHMSDVGHMRYGPKASLMFDLTADYSSMIADSLGIEVFRIKGTNMFNLAENAVREHADLFGDRLYTIETDKKSLVLRYAACHQQFSMLKDWNISYRQLPFGAFEVADSYRLEQSGEAMLCFRVRRMNLPDLHVVCRDEEDAKDWLLKVHDRIMEEARTLNRDYELLVNVSSRKAFDDNKQLLLEILKKEKKDALIHMYPEGKNFYWTLNIEYVVIDDNRRPREIATVQIDVGNAERFNIQYTGEEGNKRFPVILHTALIGSIERYIYMILDTAVRMERDGKPGYIPLWLNPEQVRLLTVRTEHKTKAMEIASILESANIRVGMDDRSLTISKKVMEAKKDWVGYIIVVGDRELESTTLKVYDRERDVDVELTMDELKTQIESKVKDKPFRPRYFPSDVSKRPS